MKPKRFTLSTFYRLTQTMLQASLLLCGALQQSQTSAMELLTEEDPPYSFIQDGKPGGFAVEIVTAIQKELGTSDKITIQPWARIYQRVQQRPNVAVFTMSRTKERESLFNWIGPIVENDWVLVSTKSNGIRLTSLNEAKKLRAIGTVRDYAWTHYLISQGFTNLDSVTRRQENSLKLMAGHIDAFVSSDLSYTSEIRENGMNPADFEIILRFNTVQMYVAISKQTDEKTVDNWRAAFEAVKRKGLFQNLYAKWLPNGHLPGNARPSMN